MTDDGLVIYGPALGSGRVAALLVPSAVHADSVLTTPVMYRPANAVMCAVVNGGSKDVDVEIAMLDQTGGSLFPPGSTTLAAGTATAVIENGVAGPGLVYCRFTVTSGSKKGIRASICVMNGGDALTAPCGASADAR